MRATRTTTVTRAGGHGRAMRRLAWLATAACAIAATRARAEDSDLRRLVKKSDGLLNVAFGRGDVDEDGTGDWLVNVDEIFVEPDTAAAAAADDDNEDDDIPELDVFNVAHDKITDLYMSNSAATAADVTHPDVSDATDDVSGDGSSALGGRARKRAEKRKAERKAKRKAEREARKKAEREARKKPPNSSEDENSMRTRGHNSVMPCGMVTLKFACGSKSLSVTAMLETPDGYRAFVRAYDCPLNNFTVQNIGLEKEILSLQERETQQARKQWIKECSTTQKRCVDVYNADWLDEEGKETFQTYKRGCPKPGKTDRFAYALQRFGKKKRINIKEFSSAKRNQYKTVCKYCSVRQGKSLSKCNSLAADNAPTPNVTEYNGNMMFKLDTNGNVKSIKFAKNWSSYVPSFMSPGRQDGFLVLEDGTATYGKIDLEGHELWTRTLPKVPNLGEQDYYGLAPVEGGATLFLGGLNKGAIHVAKIAGQNGKVLWRTRLNWLPASGPSSNQLSRELCKIDKAGAVIGTSDGGVLFTGSKVKGYPKHLAKNMRSTSTLGFLEDEIDITPSTPRTGFFSRAVNIATATLGYCATKGCNFDEYADLWAVGFTPKGKIRSYHIPYSLGKWPSKSVLGLTVSPSNVDGSYIMGGSVCDPGGKTKAKRKSIQCRWDTRPFLIAVDTNGQALGKPVVWSWKGYSQIIAIKPLKRGKGMAVLATTSIGYDPSSKQSGKKYGTNGATFLCITNGDLQPTKKIKLQDHSIVAPTWGHASYIYKWKSWSLEVTTDGGILVVADELAVKFDANLNALPPLEMVNTDQRFVENHVDKNCSKSERPMTTTINGEDSIHSQQTDSLEPTQIRQLAASIDQTRSNIAKAEQDLRDLRSELRTLEDRYANATSAPTSDGGAHLGAALDGKRSTRSFIVANGIISCLIVLFSIGRRFHANAAREETSVSLIRRCKKKRQGYGAVAV